MAKHRRIVIAVAVVAVLLVWWLRREPDWKVTLDADQTAEITPWQSVALTAHVEPADAMSDRLLKWGAWKFTWDVDSTPLVLHGPSGAWRSGKIGDHLIRVTVESPWGTKRIASVHKTVGYRSYVLPDSSALHAPDLTALPTDPDPDNLPFGIADVWVEKTKVCQGEPSRIRLTAFDKRGQDNWLVPVVAGEQAWEVACVVPPTHPGPRMVPVTLFDAGGTKGGHVDSIDTYVYIEVLDCIAPFPMFVEHRPIPPDNENIAFRLKLYDGPAWVKKLADATAPSPEAHATTFRWEFGDGMSETTTEPRVRHRYPGEADRSDERQTLYKVRVEALDGAKVLATSFASIEVPNHLRELKREQGLLQLLTQQAPGSNENMDGSRYTDVVLANIDATETARITAMAIDLISCDGQNLGRRTADPASVFSKLVVAPHSKISGRFSLPPIDGACFANAEVSGTSEPGKLKVLGFFQLVTTAEPPGVELDDEKAKVLQQAMELLGNPKIVTNEDLRRLENEGKIPRNILTKDPFAQ